MNEITRVSLVANKPCNYIALHVLRGESTHNHYFVYDGHNPDRLVRFFLAWLSRQPGAQVERRQERSHAS